VLQCGECCFCCTTNSVSGKFLVMESSLFHQKSQTFHRKKIRIVTYKLLSLESNRISQILEMIELQQGILLTSISEPDHPKVKIDKFSKSTSLKLWSIPSRNFLIKYLRLFFEGAPTITLHSNLRIIASSMSSMRFVAAMTANLRKTELQGNKLIF
jgi:hypothetical protein